jgi:hypothetical protein
MYWSSSPYADAATHAWGIGYLDGGPFAWFDRTDTLYVHCVRTGP